MPLKNCTEKLLRYCIFGLFIWFFASSLSIAYQKAPQHDDAMFATIPKNFLNGYGWATSYGEKIPFNPDISTGPTLLLPAMIIMAVFGNQTWVPAITGTGMNIALTILILWQLWRSTTNRVSSCLALLLSLSLFAVNDFKTFTAYYTCALLFLFALLIALNQRFSISARLITYGALAAIGFYGKPLILFSFMVAGPCILFFEHRLAFKKYSRSLLLILIGFFVIFSPWQFYKTSVISNYSDAYQTAYRDYDKKFFENHGTGIGQLKNANNKFTYLKLNIKKNYRILSRFLSKEYNFPIYVILLVISAAIFFIFKNKFSISVLQAGATRSIDTVFPAILAFVIFANLFWYVIFSFAMTPGHAFFLTFFSFFLLFLLIATHSRPDNVGVILCVLSALFFQVRIPPLIEAYRFKVADIIDNSQILNTLAYLKTNDHHFPFASCGYNAAPYRMEYLLPQSQNFVDCYNVLEDSLAHKEIGEGYYWRDAPNFTFVLEKLSFLTAAQSQGYILGPIIEACQKHILFQEGIFVVCDVRFDEIRGKLDPTETAKQLVNYQGWYRTRIKAY